MKKRLNDVTPEEWDKNKQDSLNVSIVDTKKQEEQFSETNKHIRSLEKRLYNPDDGVIVKVNSLNI